MKRVALVRTLKGVVIFLAALAVIFYGFVFPQLIRDMGAVEFTWLVKPATVAVSLSAIPIAAALVLHGRGRAPGTGQKKAPGRQ